MRMNKLILYGLFGITFLVGLAAVAYLLTNQQSSKPDVLPLKQTPKILVSDSSQQMYLVTYDAVDLISIRKPYVLIGADSLEYQTITATGKPLYIPVKPAVWQNYWAGVLGASVPGREDQRWQIAQHKWRAFVQPELDSLNKQTGANTLSPENQLCHALLHKILSNPAQTFFVRNKSLESTSFIKEWSTPDVAAIQIQVSDPVGEKFPKLSWLLTIMLLITGLAGLIYTRLANTSTEWPGSSPLAVIAEETDQKIQPSTGYVLAEPDQEVEAIRHYVRCFANRYGDFYQMLENLPEPITDEPTKKAIRRQLVEMALHAQSFMRASSLAKMQRPQGEPNLLLITNNWQVSQLDPQTYQLFTDDPYKTSKRYRLLQQILAEMHIGHLEGALLHDIYLTADYLT